MKNRPTEMFFQKIEDLARNTPGGNSELSDGERRLHRRRLRRKRLSGNGASMGTPRLGIW